MTSQPIIVWPPVPVAGCLAVIVPQSRLEVLKQTETEKTQQLFVVRAYLSDHIPLFGDIKDVLVRTLFHGIKINTPPLSIYLHHGGRNATFYDLVADDSDYLQYIEVEVEAELPSMAFNPARTAINELLDSLQRHVWFPVTISRLELSTKGDVETLAFQIILPFPHGLSIGPLGGIHQYPAFTTYEAVLREAIVSTSPYYRFLCAYRLYEGLNTLRSWMKKIANEFKVAAKLPNDPPVDRDMLLSFGVDVKNTKISSTRDLWVQFKDLRNHVAHFFLKDNGVPLHFSDGRTYHDYSVAGAILLYHANRAFNDLLLYFNAHLSGHLARGTVLPMLNYRDKFVIRSKK